MSATEQWRVIPGYEGYYEVSDQGSVRSLDRTIRNPLPDGTIRMQNYRGRILKSRTNSHGYRAVNLYRDGRGATVAIHLLVLLAFVGPRPRGMETRHLNSVQADNRLENLTYGTALENAADVVANGSYHPHRGKTHCKHGHPFSGSNLKVLRHPDGRVRQRICLECVRATGRATYHRLRDAQRTGGVA